MSGYRFCRTDDIGLLVDALNRCWHPHFPGEDAVTPESFKRSIRDLQVWCSSCMVAFSGDEPIGVLIGAKRASATLVHTIAVHPDHVRQSHGRHLLTSLGSKLAILGPPRIVAEVPDTFSAACGLFEASGYTEESVLTDYVAGDSEDAADGPPDGRFVIPITVDDLAANGILPGAASQWCWERGEETLAARRNEMAGLAVASDEQIDACILYIRCGGHARIGMLRTFVADDGVRLRMLLSLLRRCGIRSFEMPRVHPDELAPETLTALGFRPTSAYRVFAARASAG